MTNLSHPRVLLAGIQSQYVEKDPSNPRIPAKYTRA